MEAFMKKFTALMLVVLMVVSVLPFSASAATWTEIDTVAELAAMKDGNYWLTADIDLSKATWTTLKEFKGTLNGNGHTITVPTDALFIEKLSGTVKNLNLKGAMTLDDADASSYVSPRDVKGGGIGALAGYAQGATIDNVDVDVDITYTGKIANFGGIVGNAIPVWEGENAETYVRKKANTISNCTVAGDWSIKYSEAVKSAIGGVVGLVTDSTVVDSCTVTVKAAIENCKGQAGGIVGSSYTDAHINAFAETMVPATVKNSLFAGDFSFSVAGLDQSAAIVGYCRGGSIINCAATGSWSTTGGGTRHILSYSNVGNAEYSKVVVKGNVSTATVKSNGNAVTEVLYSKNFGAFVTDNILVTGQTVRVEIVENKVVVDTNPAEQVKDNATAGDAAAALAKFAQNNAEFKLDGGKLSTVTPAFTPSKNPSEVPAPTGDMTFVLVSVAVVSLAAVTVIAKKKVTD